VTYTWWPGRVVALPSGIDVGRINEVTLRRARLVLRWVTVLAYTVPVCNHPLRPTQSPTLIRMGNEYPPKGGVHAAGNVTVGLASHWSRVKDWRVQLRDHWLEEGRWASRVRSSKNYGTFYVYIFSLKQNIKYLSS